MISSANFHIVRFETIRARIIEMPENEEQAELYRNPHSGFLAYVPVGSINKGNDLVTTGGARIVGKEFIRGKTTPCITCHGPDLMGVADIPPIAGRSPSYRCGRCGICGRVRNSEAAHGGILKSDDSCTLNPKSEIADWTVQFAISDFGFKVQESSDFRFPAIS